MAASVATSVATSVAASVATSVDASVDVFIDVSVDAGPLLSSVVNASVIIVTNSVPIVPVVIVGTDVVLVVVSKVVGGSRVVTCLCASIVLTLDFLAGRLFDVFLEPHGYIRFN